MKTMTQLQAELRAAAEHIENLSRELAQLQPSEQKKTLDFAHIQTIGKRYPIRDHCLVRMDADFQRQYLTLLTAPLLLESREPENGWLFLQRILCGVGCAIPLTDLQADAASLTEQQLDTFSAAVLERGLVDALMLDGMLLFLACQGGETMRDWLAALATLLACTLSQVQELADLAALIAGEDETGLRAFAKRTTVRRLRTMNGYILPILKWYAQVEDGVCYYYGDGETPLDVDGYVMKLLNKQRAKGRALLRVEIRNAVMAEKAVYLNMGDCQLLMEDCTVRDISCDKTCFKCNLDESLVFRHCRFERLSSYFDEAIEIESNLPFILENVHFHDIINVPFMPNVICFSQCQMRTVTMENIYGGMDWYGGKGGTATPDCYYKNCKGRTSGLPDGLKEKKEA